MAWERYYTDEHVETVLRRSAAVGANASNTLFLATWFMGSIRIEHIHPLESGLLRRRARTARRPGLPVLSPLQFYPSYWLETATKLYRWAALYLGLRRKYLRIKHNPKKFEYMDLALTPVTEEEEERELFNTESAQAYLTQEHRLEKLRAGASA
jgi:hypothetical protein